MDLASIRQEIDKVDADLVALLEKRLHLVNQVVAYKQKNKQAILDKGREEEILRLVSSRVVDKSVEEAVVATFEDVMKQSRHYQSQRLS